MKSIWDLILAAILLLWERSNNAFVKTQKKFLYYSSFLMTVILALISVILLFPLQSQAAPPITWTPSSITETLAQGDSNVVSVTFTSSKDINNTVTVWVVPELQPYIQVDPQSFPQLSQGKTVNIEVKIYADLISSLGTFNGTIHLKDGSKTLAKPLPVTVNVIQATINNPPVADAGRNQDVMVGETVTLDGRNSYDPDGDQITYSWAMEAPEGSDAELNDINSVMPSFIPDIAGNYICILTVSDGELSSSSGAILVTAAYSNVAPTADAGPNQNVVTGSIVTLDGTGSYDPDYDPLTYTWEIIIRPHGSTSLIDDASSETPNFVADEEGDYIIHLTVNDGELYSQPDEVVIISATPNAPPVADAGDDHSVPHNTIVTLDGTGSSDPDNDEIYYEWTIVSSPSANTLDDPSSANPQIFVDFDGEYVFSLTVFDGELDSESDAVVVTAYNSPPVANAGQDRKVTVGTIVTLSGNGSDPNGDFLTYQWTMIAPSSSTAILSNPTSLNPTFTPDVTGIYTIELTVSDGSLQDSDTLTVTVQPPKVIVPDVVDKPQATAVSDITSVNLSVGAITQENNDTIQVGNVTRQNPAAGSTVQEGTAVNLVISLGSAGPPDPADVAPEIDPTVATTVYDSTAFLYTGDNPIQTGVEPETVEAKRAAVLRGNVTDKDSNPLSGITITVHNHPEFGQTLTRSDGMFDMAVNGGGYLTVNYQKDGYLPAQRQVDVPWQDYALLPDVVMMQKDNQVTTVDLNSSTPIQVAQGSVVTDEDGTRQATLLFPQGTQAELVMPDGTTQAVSNLNVRATEYTVGPNGPKAMPAKLPPESAYTYAVEFSVDEALSVGAKSVHFNQPIPFYVENFLNFPIGGIVPAGYYDLLTPRINDPEYPAVV